MDQEFEQRQDPRHRTLKGGLIFYNGDRSTVDCVVRNQSETGARLEVEAGQFVPDSIDLLIRQEERLYPCQVMWRKGHTMGVRFTEEPKLVNSHKKLHEALRR